MICESQKAVVEFLSSPSTYGGAAVQQIDTHLSHVFLVGARVYKIKRAVRYDFVDFSTVALRKEACAKEVSINRRTAPQMYLGVVPIHGDGDGVSWNNGGEIVEWAVEMVRFDAGDQLDELLSSGKLSESMVLTLADKIAAFHINAAPVTEPPPSGLGAVLDQVAASLHEHEIGAAREKDISRWAALASAEFERYATLLELRRRHGWVRHCHGDLHLANICLIDGEPTPFDAIEFNDDLANIDVLYDLAFLLMDLVNHNRADYANQLLNRYLIRTRDYAGVGLLRLFQSTRAAVRAMVLSLPTQPEQQQRMADRYLDLALEYLIGESEPQLIAVGGYSGAGKSTLAKSVALEFDGRCGAALLNSDVIRKVLAGRAPEQRLDDDAYLSAFTARVYERMFKYARRALRAGQSVILDATFLDPDYRRRAEETAKKANVPFKGLWLTARRDVLTDRVSSRLGGASDATMDVLEKQLQSKQAPTDWLVVDASDGPRNTLANARVVLAGNNK